MEYHVSCGLCGIYAGVLNKNGTWRNGYKSDVTQEAIGAVAQYMLFDNGVFNFSFGGKKYLLKVVEVEEVSESGHMD